MKSIVLTAFLLSSFITIMEGAALDESVFLGNLIRSEDAVFVQLDLFPVLRKRNISDEDLAKLFTKVSGKQPHTDDITIDVSSEDLVGMLPSSLLKASQKFHVALGSQSFAATSHKFVLQNSVQTYPEWLLGLQLVIPKSVKTPEQIDEPFVIASMNPLPAPVVYQKTETPGQDAISFLQIFGSNAIAAAKQRMMDLATRRKNLSEVQLDLLDTFERTGDPNEGGQFLYFASPENNGCLYASYTSGEMAGFSALYKYCSDRKVETIAPMEFEYLTVQGSSGTIVELDVDQDSVNEIFFQVTFWEGVQTFGYRKDPSGKFIPFVQTDYTGV